MCRIMAISNLTKVKDLNATLLKVRDLVSEANKDGFGYSISYKNSLFNEKFLSPEDFVGMEKSLKHEKMELSIFENNFSLASGEIGDRPLALIAHGRTSTNRRGSVDYSHPFVKGDQAFIHNGVVDVPRNHAFDLDTDNDSEYLANVYWSQGVEGMTKINGYFAFMNLKLNGKLEVTRDNLATLFAAYIPEIDSYVFATLERMISSFCTTMKYQSTKIAPVADMSHFTVQGSKINGIKTVSKSSRVKRLTSSEEKAFKDYDKRYAKSAKISSIASKGTNVLANDVVMPSRFNDPHYWEDDNMIAHSGK